MLHEEKPAQQESAMASLGPDILAPEEFLGTLKRTVPLEAEKRLLLAVLKDGLYCFQKYCLARSARARRLFSETEAWIADSRDDWVFSFENICDSFGWDPTYLRRGLALWKQKALRQAARGPVSPAGAKRKLARKQKMRVAA
jgi:hypothetical protein